MSANILEYDDLEYCRIAERLRDQFREIRPQYPEVTGKLFHYTTAGGLIGIVSLGALWATSSAYLNDSQEWQYGAKLAHAALEGMQSALTGPMVEVVETVKRWLSEPSSANGWYVACFCSDGDLLSQWRSYSDRGGGYCLQFDLPSVTNWAYKHEAHLIPIEYNPSKQSELFEKHFRDALRILNNDRLEGSSIDLWVEAADAQMRTVAIPLILQMKHPSFEQEGERRLVYFLGSAGIDDDHRKVRHRAGDGFVIPYLELPLDGGDGLPLLSVRCGPTTDKALAESGVRDLLRRHKCRHVDVRSSEIPYRG